MKAELKRIEATLQQTGTIKSTSDPRPAATAKKQTRPAYSFEIYSTTQKRHATQHTLSEDSSAISVQSAQINAHPEPQLPNFNRSSKDHRRVSRPIRPPWLEAPTDVVACQKHLQQIVHQIQTIYQEGPIVDGWLESSGHKLEPTAQLSRESSEYRTEYVAATYGFEGRVTCESPRAGYLLCGLDAAGQKWSRPCPLEQLPSVSLAIARYQKLQQLLERKKYLEVWLTQQIEQRITPS